MQLQKTGVDTGVRVRRRLVRLRHLMSTVIIRGMQNGEFKKLNVKTLNELLYGLIESAIFRLSLLGEEKMDDIRDSLNMAVDGILAPKQ
jgi:hypothetical protein